jgi:UDP-N-acetylglucosamine acyltransferase
MKFRLFSGEQPKISPQAVVDETAEIDESVEIGPFCVVGPHVKIGPGCKLLNNVTILGHTTIGRDNIFFPNAVIGAAPQDLKYRGAPTLLEIGDGNVFREAVTVHVGTEKGGGVTRVGSSNLLMINCHLGHDVQLGSRCVISNNVMIAGHVVIGNNVSMMGLVGIHHFVTIGDFAYLGGAARIHHDVPPFVKVDGEDKIRALNTVGLKRAGFADDDIQALRDAVRKLWFGRKRNFSGSARGVRPDERDQPAREAMVEFLQRRDKGKHGRLPRKPAHVVVDDFLQSIHHCAHVVTRWRDWLRADGAAACARLLADAAMSASLVCTMPTEISRSRRRRNSGEVFDSVEKMAERVEAVTIAVPDAIPRLVAEPLTQRKIACLIEKPLAKDVNEAKSIVRWAKESGAGRAGRAHRALQPDRPLDEQARRAAALHRSDPNLAADIPQHRRRRGARRDDPRHRHRAEARALAGRGSTRRRERDRRRRGHLQRPPHVRQRLRRQHDRVALALKTERKLRVFSADAYVSIDYQKRYGIMASKTRTSGAHSRHRRQRRARARSKTSRSSTSRSW